MSESRSIYDSMGCLDYDVKDQPPALPPAESARLFLEKLYSIKSTETKIGLTMEFIMLCIYPPKTSIAAVLTNSGGHPDADLSAIDEVYKQVDMSRLESAVQFTLAFRTDKVPDKEKRLPHRAAVVKKAYDLLADKEPERATRLYGKLL